MAERQFTAEELNTMTVEATMGRDRTEVKGEGAQDRFAEIRKEVRALKAQGFTPEPAQE